MGYDLNKEYFKTREKHKKNEQGCWRYIIWLILCIITFIVVHFLIKKK